MSGTVGVVGLGAMGGAIASRLAQRPERKVIGWDPNPQVWPALDAAGIDRATSLADLLGRAGTLLSLVDSDAALADILEAVVGAKAPRPSLVAVMGTHSPALCLEFAERGRQHGVAVVQAPVSGGRSRALAGKLTVMGSGARDAWDSMRPLVEDISSATFYCGEGAAAQAMKLVNNLLTVINLFATAEAITLAETHGLELELVRDIVSKSSGSSRKFVETIDRLLEDDPLAGSRAGLRILLKDIGLAVDGSTPHPQPLAQSCQALLDRLVEEGHGGRDVEFVVPWTAWQGDRGAFARYSSPT